MGVVTEWWELRLLVKDSLADDLGAVLIDSGAGGVQIRDEATGPPPPGDDPPPPELPSGTAEIIATYPGGERPSLDDISRAMAMLSLPPPCPDSLRHRHDEDWPDRWKEYFVPLAIGERLWVVPSWEREQFIPPADAICLALEPGMAFGTGQHATTALCAELLEQVCVETPPRTLLDVGCGSGILSIAAVRLGVAHAVGIDIDADAIVVARDNARANSVSDRVHLSTTPVRDVAERFAWVIANILAPILIELAEPIVETVEARGTLVLSGLLQTQRAEVLDAYERAAEKFGRSLSVANERRRDEWLAVALTLSA